MIFKLIFSDKTEFVQAKDLLRLLQSYEQEYGDTQLIEDVFELTEEQAKGIMLQNSEYTETNGEPKELSLYDLACGDDFAILGGTDF